MLFFQGLLQKWQDALNIQRTQNDEVQDQIMREKMEYTRVETYT
jgi:hypothetical protein